MYSYKRCDVTTFQKVKPTENGLLSHFAMNGSSILPPLMLGVQPNDKIYDACASPGKGGKVRVRIWLKVSHVRLHHPWNLRCLGLGMLYYFVNYDEKIISDVLVTGVTITGGKSLLLLQTLMPITIVCNDIDHIRLHKVLTTFKNFLDDYKHNWKNERIFLTNQDARECSDYGVYDKVSCFENVSSNS